MKKTTKSPTSAKKIDRDGLPTKKLSEIKRHRSYVLYGRAGSGKTTLAGDFPKPILYLDVRDRGTDSIADMDEDDIDILEIEDFEQIEDTHLWLMRNPKKYKTVVIDTMSQVQEMLVEETMDGKNLKGKRAGDWGTMGKQDWGQVSSKLKSMIVDYRDLPMEVVFIAQDKTFNLDDEDTDNQLAPEVGPQLMPSVVKVLNAAVSVIGNTFIRTFYVTKEENGKKRKVEKKEYCLRIGPNSLYITKVRNPKDMLAPDYIRDPSYKKVLQVIQGEDIG